MKSSTSRREFHNTAKKIFDDVNQAKFEMGLGSKPLSVKTIADHLRAVFSGSNTEDKLSSV